MRFLLPLVALLTFAACGGGSSTSTPTASGPTQSPSCEDATPGGSLQSIAFPRGTGLNEPVLVVEVADNAAERATGLMNRSCLAPNGGMIFAWHTDTTAGFWMEDTEVPLSIAFIQADGRIVHIEDMQPETTNNHTSPEPYRYAIEANRGWFAASGVSEGGLADIPATASENAKN